jgi:heme-degrading monooxygenase HmoA
MNLHDASTYAILGDLFGMSETKEGPMYLRVVRGTLKPGKLDAFAQLWQEVAGARLQQVPGFQRGYLSGNRETNQVIGVTIWDTPPDPERARQAMQAMVERAGDLIASPPEPTDYDVLVEI